MKKNVSIFLLLFLMLGALCADSKYIKNDTLRNTMYVNSWDGLRVRDTPDLSGKRMCGLPNALPVKLITVGKEAEIDGIKDNWIKILIPAYEWKSDEPEYGWVFGGYLSEKEIEYNFDSVIDITNFLSSKMWKMEEGWIIYEFKHNGKIVSSKLAAGGGITGPYTVISKKQIKKTFRFYDEDYISDEKTEIIELEILSPHKIKLNGEVYVPYIDAVSYDLKGKRDFVYGNYNNESLYSFIFKHNPYRNYTLDENAILKVVDELIKYGVDPMGSGYEERYEAYWTPRMKKS